MQSNSLKQTSASIPCDVSSVRARKFPIKHSLMRTRTDRIYDDFHDAILIFFLRAWSAFNRSFVCQLKTSILLASRKFHKLNRNYIFSELNRLIVVIVSTFLSFSYNFSLFYSSCHISSDSPKSLLRKFIRGTRLAWSNSIWILNWNYERTWAWIE